MPERKRNDTFHEEVAAKFGVSKHTVRNWERNRTAPALRYVPRILEFLEYVPCSLDQ